MTMESSEKIAVTFHCVNVSGYMGHATVFGWLLITVLAVW